MRSATVAKWLQENAHAPPPPTTPAGLPDDSASTVYPESSVSNPYASRYTGARHRTSRMPQQPPYLERRPSTAQGHYREQYTHHPPVSQRQRHNSFSADSRYVPAQAQTQAYTYAYTQPQSSQMYVAPPSTRHAGHAGYTRGGAHRAYQPSQYQVVPSSSPHRVEVVRPRDTRQYTTYANYASTPALSPSRSSPTKKTPFLRRIFGIEWGSAPKQTSNPSRHSSRSSSKSKSKTYSSEHDAYRPVRPVRPRTRSDGVVYVRY